MQKIQTVLEIMRGEPYCPLPPSPQHVQKPKKPTVNRVKVNMTKAQNQRNHNLHHRVMEK